MIQESYCYGIGVDESSDRTKKSKLILVCDILIDFNFFGKKQKRLLCVKNNFLNRTDSLSLFCNVTDVLSFYDEKMEKLRSIRSDSAANMLKMITLFKTQGLKKNIYIFSNRCFLHRMNSIMGLIPDSDVISVIKEIISYMNVSFKRNQEFAEILKQKKFKFTSLPNFVKFRWWSKYKSFKHIKLSLKEIEEYAHNNIIKNYKGKIYTEKKLNKIEIEKMCIEIEMKQQKIENIKKKSVKGNKKLKI